MALLIRDAKNDAFRKSDHLIFAKEFEIFSPVMEPLFRRELF